MVKKRQWCPRGVQPRVAPPPRSRLSAPPAPAGAPSKVLYVFADDWKGGTAGKPDSPVCYFGHVLSEEEVVNLAPMLASIGAAEWHATDRRGLIQSDRFDEVLGRLEAAPSQAKVLMRKHSDLDVDLFDELDSRLTQAHQEPASGDVEWVALHKHFRESAYSIGLLEFLRRMANQLKQENPGQTLETRVCCDEMDFFSKAGQEVSGGPRPWVIKLSDGDPNLRMELLFVGDRMEDVAHLRPFMGLVDSLAWGFGRMQTRTLKSSGLTIWQAMWRYREAKDEALMPTNEELAEALSGEAPRVLAVIQLLRQWTVGSGRLKML